MPLRQLEQTKKKNFGLSESEFDELVIALQKGDDELFEKIYLNHFEYCVRYLINQRGANYEDAYTCTMNTLLEIRKDLILGKVQYGNLAYFFTYRAGKKWSKVKEKNNRKLQVLSLENVDIKDDKDILQELQTKEMAGFVEKSLASLGEECRQLLKLYYYEGLSWPKIAKLYFPNADAKMVLTKSDTLKKRSSRRCLPKFKSMLEQLLK